VPKKKNCITNEVRWLYAKKNGWSICTATALRSYSHLTFNVHTPYLFCRIYCVLRWMKIQFCYISLLFFSWHLLVFFRRLFIVVGFFVTVLASFFFIAVPTCLFSMLLASSSSHCFSSLLSLHCSRYLILVLVTYFRRYFLIAFFVCRCSRCLTYLLLWQKLTSLLL